MFYLPRLQREFYQADSVVLWTLPIQERKTGWLTAQFHQTFRELILHTAARENLLCPIYCLMPDHIHLIWMGTSLDSDQKNGMAFLRTYLDPMLGSAKFQVQPHDHVLRDSERKRRAFSGTCGYLRDNPLRANLVTAAADWPYTDAVVPGFPRLDPFAENYWDKFWKIYYAKRDPRCNERKLPPRSTRPSADEIPGRV